MTASATDRVRREAPLRRESPIRLTGTTGQEFQAMAAASLRPVILASLCLPDSNARAVERPGLGRVLSHAILSLPVERCGKWARGPSNGTQAWAGGPERRARGRPTSC